MSFHSDIDILLCKGGGRSFARSAIRIRRKDGARSEDDPGSLNSFGSSPAYSHTPFAATALMKGVHRITTRRRKVRARRVSFSQASNRGLEV